MTTINTSVMDTYIKTRDTLKDTLRDVGTVVLDERHNDMNDVEIVDYERVQTFA